ncbi:type III restriction endonuclease subunit M [Aeromonas salmonicida]|nr:type III restriction endonuclease subunit M [Aeromonas salmonicida]ASI28944.1 type III restriction endonuclease subunit M [Aeromonas salmonicida]
MRGMVVLRSLGFQLVPFKLHRFRKQRRVKYKKSFSIAELTKERLRRAGAKVSADNPDWQGDTGFRVFKLDTSNIRPWSADAASLDAQMQASLSPLLEDRSQDDVMTELLLKRGIDLSVRLEVRDFDGLRVTCAGNGMLFTCLESHIPASSIEALASGLTTWHRELGGSADAVCYFIDEAFENNVAKSNLCATLVQQGLNQLHSL